jgi:hypothetical protein
MLSHPNSSVNSVEKPAKWRKNRIQPSRSVDSFRQGLPAAATIHPPEKSCDRFHYLGHQNIQHTVRYTELSPERFNEFWKD